MILSIIKGSFWAIFNPRLAKTLGFLGTGIAVSVSFIATVVSFTLMVYLLTDPTLRDIEFSELRTVAPWVSIGFAGFPMVIIFIGVVGIMGNSNRGFLFAISEISNVKHSVAELNGVLMKVRSADFSDDNFIRMDGDGEDLKVIQLISVPDESTARFQMWFSRSDSHISLYVLLFEPEMDTSHTEFIRLALGSRSAIYNTYYLPIVDEIIETLNTPDVQLNTALRNL